MAKYRIVEWDQRYEVDSKGGVWTPGDTKRAGPLLYIREKVHGKSQGLGWRRLIQAAGQRRAPLVFGIFAKLKELAGDETCENRGFFEDDDKCPLSFVLGLDDRDIKFAISVLCNIGWVKAVDADSRNSPELPEIPGIPRNSKSDQSSSVQFSSDQYIPPVVPQGTLELSGSSPQTGESIAGSESPETEHEQQFDEARKLFPGTKRGFRTEFDNFRKKHKDWREVCPDLVAAIKLQVLDREAKAKRGEFVPYWKNFQTWVNNRWWETAEHVTF